MQNVPCSERGTPPSQTLAPLGCFAPSQFSSQIKAFGDMAINVISRGARSLIIEMNLPETSCSTLDVIILPLAIWRKSYSSKLCSKIYASETSFFGLKMQKYTPSQTLPPLGRFAHSQFSSQITFGGFRRHGITFFSYMSKMCIWYFLIHDELLENCYEKLS